MAKKKAAAKKSAKATRVHLPNAKQVAIAELMRSVEALELVNDDLERINAAFAVRLERHEGTINEGKAIIENLQGRITDLKATIVELGDSREDLANQLSDATSQVTLAKARSGSLESKLKLATDRIEIQANTIEQLQTPRGFFGTLADWFGF